ncbi:MAG: hypothetical protein ACKO1L_03825 [Brachymonas sp.]
MLTLICCALLMWFPALTAARIDIGSHTSKLSQTARWLLTFPFILSIFVLATVLGIYGWSSALGTMLDTPIVQVPMTVKSYAERLRTTRSYICPRVADLKYQSDEAKICLDGIYTGAALYVGQRVLVNGKISVFGFYIEQVTVDSK